MGDNIEYDNIIIKNFPNYTIDINGNVYNIKRKKFLKQKIDKDGYKIVTLFNNGNRKDYKVHRLVAENFISNPNNYLQINHIDENKENNNINNLEWCNSKYNNNYGTKKDRASKKLLNREDCSKKIQQFSLNGQLINTFPSEMEASRATGICRVSINKNVNGKQKSAGGFIWKKL